MKSPARSDADELELDELLTDDERRPLDIALDVVPPIPASNSEDLDACCRKLNLEAEIHGPAQMRKSGEVDRLLNLLDELDGTDGPDE